MDIVKDPLTLKRACSNYAEKYGYKSNEVERGLEAYAAHLFAQEEGFNAVLDGAPTADADLQESICRANDLGIDVVLQDDVGKRLILVQAAWRKKDLEEDKVASFFDSPDRLKSAEYRAQGGEQIQELLSEFEYQLKDGWEISLRFVTNARIGMNDRLLDLVDSKNARYEERDQAITCELFGESELIRHDQEMRAATTGGITEEVDLTFQAGKFMTFDVPYRTIVGAIKANELVNLYRRRGVGNTLFNLNIRLPLTSKRVNPAIADTAVSETEGEHFFYYNNGVSAVCSKFTLVDNTVHAKRFQIINGAQTVSALVKAFRRTQKQDVYVLFRLTETVESYGGVFTENIIRYNNTQNPVKVSDFFANDPIQQWLRDHLGALSGKGPVPTFYYVYKSGWHPKGATGKGIRIEQAAAIRHAFTHGPVPGYREPQQFFDRAGLYWEAFGSKDAETDSWSDEEVAQFGAALSINERLVAVVKELKANDATKDLPETKYLLRLSRYALGLVGVGLETIRAETFNDYSTLIASTTTFEKYVDPIVKSVRRVMRAEWARRQSAGTEVRPEYNFARDLAGWFEQSELVRQEALSDVLPDVR
ncbi:MAG: AIPR family protein [Cryobacterium sp.]|nr:AIPR family protein [Cryobacterium sp.]